VLVPGLGGFGSGTPAVTGLVRHHEPEVAAESLVRRYGAVTALDGVDLSIAGGGVVGLLGPNGAGKTTLLRVLATLSRPSSGTARVLGHDVAAEPAAVRRVVGYLGHGAMLHGHLTVEENLRFHARLHGARCDEARLAEVLQALGLSPRRHAPARTLSRGLAQRASIARVLLHGPPVLLLDEPHTGLDRSASEDLDLLLRRLALDGRLVLWTTHDLERAYDLADRLVVLAHGRVVWSGAADQRAPLEVERALARPARAGAGPPAGGGSRVPGAGPARAADGVAPPDRAADGVALPARAADGVAPPDRAVADRPAAGPTFAAVAAAVFRKDVLAELRSREVVPPVLVFALLMVVVFQFAMPSEPLARQSLAPGALWVALLFGSTLGLARLMAGEADGAGFDALLASPADRGALFVGKWLSGYAFSLLVAALLLPAFVALLAIRVAPPVLAALGAVVALGLVGWVAAGVLLAAMTTATRAREVLLPVLLYPLVLPLVVPAVQAAGSVLAGGGAGLAAALVLIAAYDVVFCVLGFLLYGRVLEE